ncbi:MAG: DUF1631 family protein [Hydrogenophaga sp.]|uniref:DUF1631 family protein n=1 Tax=Hydrogenophaga sp. TaxID=1904254 RepID=UPI0016AC7E02|nr:DUF1631 family protein [Hydrogenophaga sp.]NIM39740.1 DUF1631 family protein [Hydrogenophaga sp.]NIN24944.1 DUF1631 family protein [Hydrogenophaga sp.]NIN29456.1 DUF1631 family protein [Hydrogenophaga sp.]NIN53979.1 DUF1631 family protein [Hydrogenophaga sp.]NIO50183.1 DUF1631 family protein [Hydrogenophaga sp.]
MVSPSQPTGFALAQQARERHVLHVGRSLPDLAKAIEQRLTTLLDQPGTSVDVQVRRDTWAAFKKRQSMWIDDCRTALKKHLAARAGLTEPASLSGQLELVAEGAIDDQILASRMAMRVLDKTSSELNELRLRVQFLERRTELSKSDILLPDVLARLLVEQWKSAGLERDGLGLVQDHIAPMLGAIMLDGYKAANAYLVANGVMETIDLQALVRRSPSSTSGAVPSTRPGPASGPTTGGGLHTPFRRVQEPGRPGANGPAPGQSGSGANPSGMGTPASGGRGAQHSGYPGSSGMGVQDETRMLTGTSPLARARMRAQGVVGRLRRMLLDHVGPEFEATEIIPPSPALQQAMARQVSFPSTGSGLGAAPTGGGAVYVDAGTVERTAVALRERTQELKQAASTPSEKATIEVVALMFQAILAEERIPPSIRVWFARLQIPVLRVALAEPEFFSALQHPARRLIDRMGSCVMGFESNVGSAALEAEIKRVVQVIEQYPETGRRVFQLVYDEFQKFLSTYLSEQSNASRFVSVAQQVEQKETLSVQYTIELRKLLDDVPVRAEVRDFLFKVWVDVLAVASVKHGIKHPDTQALKQAASDLLWAASAKPSRDDRARVIQQLPGILQRLRQGMGLLGFPQGLQDQHIKSVSDTLADAFMSRTESIAQSQLDALSKRLANLEDYLPEGGVGDFDLNADSIELITGVDASNIEVINQGGSQPNEAMRAWAVELQIGSWFGLDHNGKLGSVQLAWRSQHGQLYLFVSNGGRCYLMPATRVAAYLQAGLLVPSEDEALTVRATREALAKLDANPERLLA